MAGGLTISTLNDSSGVLATQNGMKGIAKAWVNWTGGSSPAIQNSFNVSSITRNAAGKFNINFTTAMPNASYVMAACGAVTTSSYNSTTSMANQSSTGSTTTNPFTTTAAGIWVTSNGGLGTYEDPNFIGVAFLGS